MQFTEPRQNYETYLNFLACLQTSTNKTEVFDKLFADNPLLSSNYVIVLLENESEEMIVPALEYLAGLSGEKLITQFFNNVVKLLSHNSEIIKFQAEMAIMCWGDQIPQIYKNGLNYVQDKALFFSHLKLLVNYCDRDVTAIKTLGYYLNNFARTNERGLQTVKDALQKMYFDAKRKEPLAIKNLDSFVQALQHIDCWPDTKIFLKLLKKIRDEELADSDPVFRAWNFLVPEKLARQTCQLDDRQTISLEEIDLTDILNL